MAETAREAWITGIGMVSCLGEGPEAHWQALNAGQPKYNATLYPPAETLARGEWAQSSPPHIQRLRDRLWTEVKSA